MNHPANSLHLAIANATALSAFSFYGITSETGLHRKVPSDDLPPTRIITLGLTSALIISLVLALPLTCALNMIRISLTLDLTCIIMASLVLSPLLSLS